MRTLDWFVLVGAVVGIVVYGVWKGRGSRDLDGYLLSNRNMRWYTIALSIMATQASAITFLSAPGQAFVDGMRFVQIYLGLPVAMVILSITAVPIYHRLKVFTAYEYLEGRFDLKTRGLAALLFLIQRGLAAGLTIYAPALILSVILGWNLTYMNFIVGVLVIIYTTSGGTKAVSWTQFQQMLVITIGMVAAFFVVLRMLPDGVGLGEATRIAGQLGRLNVIDFQFDLANKYNFWSGLIGGLFLSLSYFGTDQSQVQRYLTGESVAQSRQGLLFNGLVKIPMQFFILYLGVMVFVFYQFTAPPLFFNPLPLEETRQSAEGAELERLETAYGEAFDDKRQELMGLVEARRQGDEASIEAAFQRVTAADGAMTQVREEAIGLMQARDPQMDPSDTNYVFLTFVVKYLPTGLVGLLIAAILFASMSSTSSELNALASTTVIDLYKRLIRPEASDRHYLWVSRLATVIWGSFAILFAQFASRLGSLIEAVNILGSLFYGTILGIFLMAFYSKRVSGTAVFVAALLAEAGVVACYLTTDISYLWYNVIGCVLVMAFATALAPWTRSTPLGGAPTPESGA